MGCSRCSVLFNNIKTTNHDCKWIFGNYMYSCLMQTTLHITDYSCQSPIETILEKLWGFLCCSSPLYNVYMFPLNTSQMPTGGEYLKIILNSSYLVKNNFVVACRYTEWHSNGTLWIWSFFLHLKLLFYQPINTFLNLSPNNISDCWSYHLRVLVYV